MDRPGPQPRLRGRLSCTRRDTAPWRPRSHGRCARWRARRHRRPPPHPRAVARRVQVGAHVDLRLLAHPAAPCARGRLGIGVDGCAVPRLHLRPVRHASSATPTATPGTPLRHDRRRPVPHDDPHRRGVRRAQDRPAAAPVAPPRSPCRRVEDEVTGGASSRTRSRTDGTTGGRQRSGEEVPVSPRPGSTACCPRRSSSSSTTRTPSVCSPTTSCTGTASCRDTTPCVLSLSRLTSRRTRLQPYLDEWRRQAVESSGWLRRPAHEVEPTQLGHLPDLRPVEHQSAAVTSRVQGLTSTVASAREVE